MTTPPDRPKPPKLKPGEPLWGTPEISSPGQGQASSRRSDQQQRGSTPTATGSARPPAGHATVTSSAPPPQPGPVQFGDPGETPPPPSGVYGRPTTYGHGGPPRDDRYGGVTPPTAGSSRSAMSLVVTGAVCLVIGVVLGLGLGWLFF